VISLSHRPLPDNTQNRHSCPPAGFEPAIPASEWPQTHALERADTGIGEKNIVTNCMYNMYSVSHIVGVINYEQ